MRLSNVYLIGPESGSPLKIGVARNVQTRLCELQIGNWQTLKVHHVASVTATIASSVEAHLHRHFAGKALRGEWFDVALSDVLPIIGPVVEAYEEERAAHRVIGERSAFHLCDDPAAARFAVTRYRNEANQGREKVTNARLLKRVGHAAYVVFTQVVVEGRDVTAKVRGNERMAGLAETALVNALNALVEIYREDAIKRLDSIAPARDAAA